MDTHFLVHNTVKVYPDRLRIVEYKRPFKKKLPGVNPSDEWLHLHQYHQHLVDKVFSPNVDEQQIPKVSPAHQLAIPFDPVYKRFYERLRNAEGTILEVMDPHEILKQQQTLADSMRRTKSNIRDIIACNDFDMFITFSFARDRYDLDLCKRRLIKWLENQKADHKRRNKTPFGYILIPEFHKDGKAIHFHGLFKGFTGRVRPATNPNTGLPLKQRGKLVYNLPGYTHGFTNMTYIVNKAATANYVTKYVTKDLAVIPGMRRYWASMDLKRPERLYNEDLSQVSKSLVYEGDNFTVSQSSDSIGKSRN